jgi:hypothetical protein
MAEKSERRKSPEPSDKIVQDRVSNVRLAPLTPEQAIRGMFQIKPEDVKRIVASKPGRKKKG